MAQAVADHQAHKLTVALTEGDEGKWFWAHMQAVIRVVHALSSLGCESERSRWNLRPWLVRYVAMGRA